MAEVDARAAAGASIYLHVPFCRSMCWYCGCHTSVTKRDDPIAVYAAAPALRGRPGRRARSASACRSRHIHFGGGTPTIMSPETFVDLIGALRHSFFVLPDGRDRRRDRSAHADASR